MVIPREQEIFEVLSNPVGLKLFKLVAITSLTDSSLVITSDFLQSQTIATRKQFYSNMSRLVNETGLISRKHGRYALSNYGKVVFHSLNIINTGSKYFWTLNALDNDDFSSGAIPAEQVLEISATLIEDEAIRRIVCGRGPMMTDSLNEDLQIREDPEDRHHNKNKSQSANANVASDISNSY